MNRLLESATGPDVQPVPARTLASLQRSAGTGPYFYELGSSTTYDVEAEVSWKGGEKPKITAASRDLQVQGDPGDVITLTPVYMESQNYGRPYSK